MNRNLPTPRLQVGKSDEENGENMGYISYLTRGFFTPRLNTSTSVLFRGIMGFEAPGAGLAVLEGGAEWMRGGGADGGDGFDFEIIEEMRSDGLGSGRAEANGGEASEACGLGLDVG